MSRTPADAGPAPASRRFATRARRLALIVAALAMIGAASAWYLAAHPDPARLVERIEAAIQAERWADAQAGIRRLERIRTPTTLDRFLRARVDAGAGDDADALDELRTIFDDPVLGPQALYMSGLIQRRHRRLRDAEAAYREALRRNPRLLSARRELIYILGMQSRRRELDAEFKAMARITPLDHYDLYIWCLTHFVRWGPDSADDLQPYVAADPADRNSRLAMARLILGQAGQEARVEEVLEPLSRDDPEVQAIRIELALNQGRVDEATRLIAGTDPDDPHLERLRGRIALRRGDRAAAVDHFRRALSDEPYDRVSNAELGKALMLQGDRAEAETYLARARHLDELYNLVTRIGRPQKDQPSPNLDRLGRVCEEAGLPDEARGWYMLAINQNALDQEAQQALHRLRAAAP